MRLTFLKLNMIMATSLLLTASLISGCSEWQAASEPEETVEAIVPSVIPTVEPTPIPTPVPTPEVVPTVTPEPTPILLERGDEGDEVLEIQRRLIELNYLAEGQDTGRFSSKTKSAVKLFQKENGLDKTGKMDDETYALLNSDDVKPYATPKPTESSKKESKSKKLTNAEKKILDNFEKYAPTVNMSFEELVGDDGIYDYPKGYPSPDTYYIIVDIKHQVTMVYTKDKNGEYTVPVRFMLCSTGANDCTPKGMFKMDSFRLRFNKFVRDGRYGQYWTQIRKAIYFHSILYTELDAATYQADIYKLLGKADSHGCVRLTVPDARWMWYHIAKGTKCEIRRGSSDDLMTAEIRKRLVLSSAPKKQLDLKPGEIPNTDNWSIDEIPLEVPFVQGSQN